MNLDQASEQNLAVLAAMHRSTFVTPPVSALIDDADLEEVALYAYGTIASGAEAEASRRDRDVTELANFSTCEESPHFWRGVLDSLGAFGTFENVRAKKRYEYPWLEVSASQLALARMGGFLERRGAFWSEEAARAWEDQVDSERGKVRLTGSSAQAAVMSIYDGASFGSRLERSREVAAWRPARGWCAAERGRRKT